MPQVIVQLVVLVFAVMAAGLKSLHFTTNGLTDFELRRRVKAGDERAIMEADFRDGLPLLDALRRLGLLLLTIIIVIILGSTNNFAIAVILALVWLFIIEFVALQPWLARQGDRLSTRYKDRLLRVAYVMRPFLKLLTDSQSLVSSVEPTFYSKDELFAAVERDTHVLDRDEKLLIRQALAYQNVLVGDIMTPRSVLTTVEEDDTVGPLLLDRL